YRLALAKHYTYREQTRREGIDLLASLARDPTVGKEAAESWRQALLWLPPNEQNLPLLRAYARSHPRDAQIARQIERARMAGTVGEGYAALGRGDLRNAERLFRSAGDDPDAQRAQRPRCRARRGSRSEVHRSPRHGTCRRALARSARHRGPVPGPRRPSQRGAEVPRRSRRDAESAGCAPRADGHPRRRRPL